MRAMDILNDRALARSARAQQEVHERAVLIERQRQLRAMSPNDKQLRMVQWSERKSMHRASGTVFPYPIESA